MEPAHDPPPPRHDWMDAVRAKKLYAKICHSEGTCVEKKFKTEAEVSAFIVGFKETIELLAPEETDEYFACADDIPSRDE